MTHAASLSEVGAELARENRWLFILAHPGHELRAHHMLELAQPIVSVLTDGSGSTGASRLHETRHLLAQVGATPSRVFGLMTDRDAYRALTGVNPKPFLDIVETLAAEIHLDAITAVLIDAAEGYNPVHDVCHWIGRAVLERARAQGRSLRAFELDLIAHPDQSGNGLRLVLDEAALARKLDAAARYRSLADETAAAFAAFGTDAFRIEFLRTVSDAKLPPSSWVPRYEEIGEERVAAGRYASVLRYGAHVRPVLAALCPDWAILSAVQAGAEG